MKNKFVDFKVLATSLCCSVVMGLISFAFLKCLDYAADFRSFFPLCYIFLPVAGIVTAFVYKRIGGKSSMGNNIIIESANDGEKVPKRLASLTFIFTCITHLFGGSVGREGTAVQIGGSLTNCLLYTSYATAEEDKEEDSGGRRVQRKITTNNIPLVEQT